MKLYLSSETIREKMQKKEISLEHGMENLLWIVSMDFYDKMPAELYEKLEKAEFNQIKPRELLDFYAELEEDTDRDIMEIIIDIYYQNKERGDLNV